MHKGRLEAFSDGVIAIIITIMVLELKVPHGSDFTALSGLLPVFVSYVLSFIYVGIYWSNHHHLLKAASGITGGVMWANLHLLFWLSLIPFVTGWMGENNFARFPTALYGFALLMNAVAYRILEYVITKVSGKESSLAAALGRNFKGNVSPVLYAAGIGVAFISPWISGTIYTIVAVMWLVPDRRLRTVIREDAD